MILRNSTAQLRCEVQEISNDFAASVAVTDDIKSENAKTGQLNVGLKDVKDITMKMDFEVHNHK